MTPEELEYVRSRLLNKSITVTSGILSQDWRCNRADWTGLRCVVMLGLVDGGGEYRDLTLHEYTPGGVTAFIALHTDALQADLDRMVQEQADAEALQALMGEF